MLRNYSLSREKKHSKWQKVPFICNYFYMMVTTAGHVASVLKKLLCNGPHVWLKCSAIYDMRYRPCITMSTPSPSWCMVCFTIDRHRFAISVLNVMHCGHLAMELTCIYVQCSQCVTIMDVHRCVYCRRLFRVFLSWFLTSLTCFQDLNSLFSLV